MRAVVVGGGLAGLSAALELVDSGQSVVLLEARPTLGGAVQTLPARDGDPEPPPDNGQHVALGCCTAYLTFLARVGRPDAVRRVPLDLPVVDERGRIARIRPGLVSLFRYRHVPASERARLVRTLRSLAALEPAGCEGETFASLLRRLGQSEPAIERFWDVVMRPALNLRSEEASAALALFTVQTALLGGREASDLLLPAAPLGEAHGDAGGAALRAAGGEVRTRARVVELEDGAAVLAGGERIRGDAFVLAVPAAQSARLLREPVPPLDDSPIVSVHLLVDRPLLRSPLTALLASPAHWVFDRGRLTGRAPERGQYLTVVSSGAPELAALRGQELVRVIADALRERLGPAEIVWSRVSREPAATFAGRPGTEALRPDAATGRDNVVRAGAWTKTGWPATMEGAIRSGKTAARLLTASATRVAA